MKHLENIAKKHNLKIKLIVYSAHGRQARGMDLIDSNNFIQIMVKPTFQKEYRFFVRNLAQETSKHIKTMHELPKLLKDFKPVEHTGYLLKY